MLMLNQELRAYRAMVEAAMKESSEHPVVFQNTGSAHAAIVLEVMLTNACRSVDIVSGYLDSFVWRSAGIQTLLDKTQCKIRVLLDELDPDPTIPRTSALYSVKPNTRIIVKPMTPTLGAHFCVVDNKHVRLEASSSNHVASVTFGDEEGVGAKMAHIFDRLWTSHEHVANILSPARVIPEAVFA
jgi:hypothetical protein